MSYSLSKESSQVSNGVDPKLLKNNDQHALRGTSIDADNDNGNNINIDQTHKVRPLSQKKRFVICFLP
ncbi:hypothetical protein D9981_02665 [Pseudoalteromonas phenolica O-BC30]|nr:hypothetical protein D9981_02665 [Pseudoalteromonas phenolica O-BC30]